MVWRIATHPTRPASAPEIIYEMCMDDVMDAHRALDAIEAMQERAREGKK